MIYLHVLNGGRWESATQSIGCFVREPDPFQFGPGELYVKVLPDGQPVALTHDGTRKMGPVFTPDGSRIVFTSAG